MSTSSLIMEVSLWIIYILIVVYSAIAFTEFLCAFVCEYGMYHMWFSYNEAFHMENKRLRRPFDFFVVKNRSQLNNKDIKELSFKALAVVVQNTGEVVRSELVTTLFGIEKIEWIDVEPNSHMFYGDYKDTQHLTVNDISKTGTYISYLI